ncbi:MAG: hypothetical protein ACKOTZ_01680, partial [Chloroflexota bacterium]
PLPTPPPTVPPLPTPPDTAPQPVVGPDASATPDPSPGETPRPGAVSTTLEDLLPVGIAILVAAGVGGFLLYRRRPGGL